MPLGQFLRDSPIKLDHETKSDQTAWRSTALLLLYSIPISESSSKILGFYTGKSQYVSKGHPR
jgi:hypothetical protein